MNLCCRLTANRRMAPSASLRGRYRPGRPPGDLTLTVCRHIRRDVPLEPVSVKTLAKSAICVAVLVIGSIGLGHAQQAPKAKAAPPAPAAAPATPATPPA